MVREREPRGQVMSSVVPPVRSWAVQLGCREEALSAAGEAVAGGGVQALPRVPSVVPSVPGRRGSQFLLAFGNSYCPSGLSRQGPGPLSRAWIFGKV